MTALGGSTALLGVAEQIANLDSYLAFHAYAALLS
jgi:hypothetical protein